MIKLNQNSAKSRLILLTHMVRTPFTAPQQVSNKIAVFAKFPDFEGFASAPIY